MRVIEKRGRCAALVLALGLIGVAAVLPPSVAVTPAYADGSTTGSATEETAETTAEDTADAAHGFELVVAPDDAVISPTATDTTFRLLLRNPSKQSLPQGSIELRAGDALTGTSALEVPDAPAMPDTTVPDASVPDTSPEPAPPAFATLDVSSTAAESVQEVTITMPTADLPFSLEAARTVYPVHASFVTSESQAAPALTAYSPVVWAGMNPGTASINVTAVVPLLLPTAIKVMPTPAELGEVAPTLTELLDAAEAAHALLAVDPRIIVAIRAYGTEAPESARDLLDRLENTTLTTFTLQFGDADVAAQSALGFRELLQPTGFEFITQFGAWPEPEPEPAPSANSAADASPDAATDPGTNEHTSTDAGTNTDAAAGANPATDADTSADPQQEDESDPLPEPGPPSLVELRAWEQGINAAWPADGQASAATIALLRATGLDTAVLRSDNVTLSGGPRATLHQGGAASNAVITDAELGAGVHLATTGATGTERDLGLARSAARLALASASGSQGLVLGISRDAFADVPSAVTALETLTAQKWVTAARLDAQAEGSAQLLSHASSAERIELLQTATENEARVLEARALLVHPEYLDGYQRMRLLSLFQTRHAGSTLEAAAATVTGSEADSKAGTEAGLSPADAAFATEAKKFAKRDRELIDGVRIVGTKHAQLVGASTRIPIQLRNTLPFDATVTLTVAPTSAVLSVPERTFTEVLLPLDSTERVLVPVKSRVSSGESALLLSVTDATGDYVASSDILPISVSTNVETIALGTLGAAALLLFGFGIWRSLRRRRTSPPLSLME